MRPTRKRPRARRTCSSPCALTAIRWRWSPAIRERVRQIDPNQPVASIQTMEARVGASVSQRRTEMTVLAVFAVMAVFLAAIGIYGVMSVLGDAAEEGNRHSHRARRRTAAGGATGVAAGGRHARDRARGGCCRSARGDACAAKPAVRGQRTDPVVFATFALILAASGWIAAYIPARRATRFDPVVTLRLRVDVIIATDATRRRRI